jgi:hypothetical protein
MEDFKIRKHLRTQDDSINEYIESLENFILNLKAENTNRLIFKLDELNGIIADDVQLIIDGEAFEEKEIYSEKTDSYFPVTVSRLKILSDSKDSKTFDRTMALYGKLRDLELVSKIVKDMLPEVEEKEKTKVKVDKSKNIFEQLVKDK